MSKYIPQVFVRCTYTRSRAINELLVRHRFATEFWHRYYDSTCGVSQDNWSLLHYNEGDELPRLTLEQLEDDDLERFIMTCRQHPDIALRGNLWMSHRLITQLDEAARTATQTVLRKYLEPVKKLTKQHDVSQHG